MEYDFAIIGSGFGGSVSALRLAQKGYKIIVIEQGREITSQDMEEAQTSVRRFNWLPELGMGGFFPRCFCGMPPLWAAWELAAEAMSMGPSYWSPRMNFIRISNGVNWGLIGKMNWDPTMMRRLVCWG